MTSPEVLMLDEPTSGLDSFTSYLIIKIMKDYALTGKTVIFTIHQPNTDIYELFDRLLLLVEGKLIYQSISSNAISYFSSIGYPCPK
jgi:ABC-type multidrug transport system ATPase subunit